MIEKVVIKVVRVSLAIVASLIMILGVHLILQVKILPGIDALVAVIVCCGGAVVFIEVLVKINNLGRRFYACDSCGKRWFPRQLKKDTPDQLICPDCGNAIIWRSPKV
jgi:predicted RNA-binding Zn-ribbon protein involved in translation (DUF1610 family)